MFGMRAPPGGVYSEPLVSPGSLSTMPGRLVLSTSESRRKRSNRSRGPQGLPGLTIVTGTTRMHGAFTSSSRQHLGIQAFALISSRSPIAPSLLGASFLGRPTVQRDLGRDPVGEIVVP
jgi:hypothetical protein